MNFTMPKNSQMRIVPSKEIDDYEIELNEIVDGIVYNIYWDGEILPWCTKTKAEAIMIAFGCQWGAFEMYEMIKSDQFIITDKKKINKAVTIALNFGMLDDKYNKMWVIDQMLRILLEDKYDEQISSNNEKDPWDRGCPPWEK